MYISFDNPDPSALNFKNQLEAAGIQRSEIVIWNTIPWYIGNSDKTKIRAANSNDIQVGINYLADVISELPNLEFNILMGNADRKAHIFLSKTTTARIVSCHHTSMRVQNSNPLVFQENIDIFRFISV